MIYLACPYSHDDPAVKVERFEAVNRVASELMNAGNPVFSPISHTHPIAIAGGLPGGWEFWEPYDRWFIERCDAVYVLMLLGWQESTGVQAELALAREYNTPVMFIDEDCVGHDPTKSTMP